ncbi:tyrosine-protein kinase hopscotch isoform X3 [Bradysia coprophila]|uniref:tyrosine-protein kinase hopscotch isoform X3 n=1 Tax=Bradysia coprophila TaxID=38358 RepID=UPI00187D7F5C|nr:tyrosine-protein kinase hopscotch isoform X3 [Bradysia coprophila]
MNQPSHHSAMPLISIFLYANNEYQEYPVDNDTCCEVLCQRICQDLEMKPLVCTLFALRTSDTPYFVPGCRHLLPNTKYDFRIRYQVKDLPTLKSLDKNAYNYFYHQVKWDLINEKIPDLVYPNHKEKVLGLIVTNMYIEMLEFNKSVVELKKNYKKYVPEKYVKKHSFIIKQRIAEQLEQIKHKHDAYYVKTAYLLSITTNAPNYFVEKCAAIASYLPEDGLERGTCPIDLEFAPHHPTRPGLSAYYSYKKVWKHISKIEDFLAIVVDNDTVTFGMRSTNVGFSVTITDKARLESFVTCVTGYYRLMATWTIDLCQSFKSPLLQELRELKCHGPIGGEFSYFKLQEKQSLAGSYIIRQCEKMYGVYYIDIITKSVHPETFKIVKQKLFGNVTWDLHSQNDVKPFSSLPELAKSIKTESANKLRLAPSDYDKAPSLLLCLPESQLTVIKSASVDIEMELRQKLPQIIDPALELRKYIHTEKIIENGIIKRMRADWLLPNNTKLEVTLKILNSRDHLNDFMNLAYKWSKLQSTELIKMYGFTLSSPYTMVIESTRLGPLDEFLADNRSISIVCLIDAAFSLARALYFLQENNTIHGKIRCSSLHVVQFNGTSLVVRLGDPGFHHSYTKADFPWIPVEYYATPQRVTTDFKAEIFSYATTVWEIFSKGVKPPLQNSLASRRRLPQPKSCPIDIYEIMLSGWDVPERRFSSPQHVFSTLISTRERNQKVYERIEPLILNGERDHVSTSSNGSIMSATTDQTLLKSEGNISNLSSENDHSSINSNNSVTDENSWSQDESDFNSVENQKELITLLSPDSDDDYEKARKVIELDHGARLIYHDNNYIGKGQYGTVYRGIMEYGEDRVIEVAIKTLNQCPTKNDFKDFQREISVMKRLDHQNIVKIITSTDIPHIAIIMQYVKHGSFLKYLSSSSPSLTVHGLLKFAKDIASGMEYLAGKKIVHRDLAARNVLIDSDEHVKISDFGLSQFVNEKGYYITQNRRFIPYKWYAPETLIREKYSFQSDVWSYGVTLFEMFSKGKEPNLEPNSVAKLDDFIQLLVKGKRLPQPELCPDNIYNSLLMACWAADTEKRPTFRRILELLNEFIAEYGEVV